MSVSFEDWRAEYEAHLKNLRRLFKQDDKLGFLEALRYPDDVDLARLFATANMPPRTSIDWTASIEDISLDKWRFLLSLDANPNLPEPASHAAVNFPLRDHSAGDAAFALAVTWNCVEAVQFLIEEAGVDLITKREQDGIVKYHRMSNMSPVDWSQITERQRTEWSQEKADEAVRKATGKQNVKSGSTAGPDRSAVLRLLEEAVKKQADGELQARQVRFPRIVSEVWQTFADGKGKEEYPEETLAKLEKEYEGELKEWRSMVSARKEML